MFSFLLSVVVSHWNRLQYVRTPYILLQWMYVFYHDLLNYFCEISLQNWTLAFYLFSPTPYINSIEHEHSCTIHYIRVNDLLFCLPGFCCLFVWFDSLRPINNLSVKRGRVFLGWTSTKLRQKCLAQGPQRNDAGEARTRGPSVSSEGLYHWATALPSYLVLA